MNIEKEKKELDRLSKLWQAQAEFSEGANFVFGIDEAGRGPLCGPVCAACCLFLSEPILWYLNDSKKLSEKRREVLYDMIIESAAAYGIAFTDEKRIDEINILNASMEAMRDAFEAAMRMYREKVALETSADMLMDSFDSLPGLTDTIIIIDGNRTVPGIMMRQKAAVHGDARFPSISAASILAKVSRDRLLKEYDLRYPEYGFARHKGYGTAEHIAAIRKYGVLDIHRKSFLGNILKSE